MYQIVIDTNVFISALRSKNGASHKLFVLLGTDSFQLNISVPLLFEYEDAAKRHDQDILLNQADIDDILDYICSVANHRQVHFLWRPYLKDSKDDFILELAVEAQCEFIITFNKRDFDGVERFGIEILTPKEFLELIGEIE